MIDITSNGVNFAVLQGPWSEQSADRGWFDLPTVTTGNTQAPCVIISERMAEIFKAA